MRIHASGDISRDSTGVVCLGGSSADGVFRVSYGRKVIYLSDRRLMAGYNIFEWGTQDNIIGAFRLRQWF
jgi:hypothetical protein